MTPERIEFWKNNSTACYKLTDSDFNELLTIDPKDLQYQDCGGGWAENVSSPLKTESLVYRLKPDYIEPQRKDGGEREAAAIVIGGISELAAAGVIAKTEDSPEVELTPTRSVMGIKIEDGEDRVFATGAKRQASAGKGLPSLLPPDALLEISKHLEAAASKYGSRNWEKGLPLSSILDSLLRHIYAELMGDTTEEHARAIGCNTLFYIATKKRIQLGILPSELDDIPKYLGTKQEIKNEKV